MTDIGGLFIYTYMQYMYIKYVGKGGSCDKTCPRKHACWSYIWSYIGDSWEKLDRALGLDSLVLLCSMMERGSETVPQIWIPEFSVLESSVWGGAVKANFPRVKNASGGKKGVNCGGVGVGFYHLYLWGGDTAQLKITSWGTKSTNIFHGRQFFLSLYALHHSRQRIPPQFSFRLFGSMIDSLLLFLPSHLPFRNGGNGR